MKKCLVIIFCILLLSGCVTMQPQPTKATEQSDKRLIVAVHDQVENANNSLRSPEHPVVFRWSCVYSRHKSSLEKITCNNGNDDDKEMQYIIKHINDGLSTYGWAPNKITYHTEEERWLAVSITFFYDSNESGVKLLEVKKK